MRLCSREWELPIATSPLKPWFSVSVASQETMQLEGEEGGQCDLMIKWQQEGILERMPAFECYVKWTMPLAEAYVPSVWDGQRRSCVTNGCHVLLFAEMGGKELWRTCTWEIYSLLLCFPSDLKVQQRHRSITLSLQNISPLTRTADFKRIMNSVFNLTSPC